METCIDIPKKGITAFFGATEQECTTIKIPDVELDNLVTGGAEFEWSINKNELYTSDYIKFYIRTKATPTSLEEVSNINMKQDVLLPVFLNE